ncbi:hypothetical protein GCM10027516_21060 [Niabella aquatica]
MNKAITKSEIQNIIHQAIEANSITKGELADILNEIMDDIRDDPKCEHCSLILTYDDFN